MKKIKAELFPALLSSGEWTAWNGKARDILKSNPEFGISPDNSDVYIVRDRPISVTEKLYNEFAAQKKFYDRVSAIREYVDNKNASPDSELFTEMFSYFTDFLHSASVDPEQTVSSCLLINELAENQNYSYLKSSLNVNFSDIFSKIKDVPSLFRNLKDAKLKTEFLKNVRLYIKEWPDIYVKLFPSSQMPSITEQLEEAGYSGKLTVMCNDCFENHRDNREAVIWLYKNAENASWFKDANIGLEKQLITLIHILDITYRDIENQKNTVENRKINKQVYDILFKNGKMKSFIDNSDEEAIIRLFTFINNVKDLDPQDKLNLRTRILEKYPGFKFFEKIEKKALKGLWVTSSKYEEKKKQLVHIMEVEIPANSKEIEYALSLGDLRENAEYKAAKEKQEQLNSQVATLKEDIDKAHIIDLSSVDNSVVSLGTKVILHNETAEKHEEYIILGPWESDPSNNIISYQSPFGSVILNKTAGERFEFTINKEKVLYLVESITPAEI
jgi:transcription elongation factor GreA